MTADNYKGQPPCIYPVAILNHPWNVVFISGLWPISVGIMSGGNPVGVSSQLRSQVHEMELISQGWQSIGSSSGAGDVHGQR